MTHWREQHNHGVAKVRRIDERFDRSLWWAKWGLLACLLLFWGIALS